MNQRVFGLVGPTASGKSAIVKNLAQHLNIEVINADSLQCYKHMTIGTAKPTPEEMSVCPHHLYDIAQPDQVMNAYEFSKLANATLKNIFKRGNIALLVGGSGFYLKAITHPPLQIAKPSTHASGNYEFLQKHDPDYAKRIHPNDQYRIDRACALIQSGLKPSKLEPSSIASPYSFEYFGVHHERQALYQRINQRVNDMLENGMIEETKEILLNFPNARSKLKKTIGYASVLRFLNNEINQQQLIEEIAQKTRNYAKRQMTWFRKLGNITWIKGDEALNVMMQRIKDKNK